MALGKTLKRHRGWIAVAVIVAIAVVAVIVTRTPNDAATTPTYTTEAAANGTLSVTVDGTGNLAVRDEVDVYPSVSGTVSKVRVAEGDEVTEGEVLYELSESEADDAVSSAKSAKQKSATSVEQAELELYRAKVSYSDLKKRSENPTSTVSSSDLKIAKKEIAIAEDGVTSANLAYSSAVDDYNDAVDALDELEVTAPCDGIVWSVSVEKGDSVNEKGASSSSGSTSGGGATGTSTGSSTSSSSSSAPVTIARGGQLGVELTINEVDVTTLEPGQDAEIEFDAVPDLKMTGTVDEVATEGTVESGVVSYSVWLNLDAADARLKTGMSAAATVVTQVERDVLLVPNSAVKTATDGTSYVQVLETGASAPTNVTVTTGAASATQTVVTSGLTEGALVVTKTSTAGSTGSDSSSSDSGGGDQGGGILMMGGDGPPAGGPGGP